ncbi:MAG: hypothetical protein K8R69_02270, partial [Deltaproteobacteria bacterium]|nr:hypothetical protein [Deltaproteobacteria bacterium]
IRPTALAILDAHRWPSEALRRCRIFLALAKSAGANATFFLEFEPKSGPFELTELMREASEGRRVVEILLPDLSLEEVRQFLQEWRGETASEEESRTLHENYGGRPLFLAEHLAYGARGLLGARRDSISKNVTRLSPAARSLLGLLAMHPFPMDSKLWESEPWGISDGESALAELDEGGFLAFRSPDSPAIRLQHPALRELYQELYPPARIFWPPLTMLTPSPMHKNFADLGFSPLRPARNKVESKKPWCGTSAWRNSRRDRPV